MEKQTKKYTQKPKINVAPELKSLLDNLKVHPRDRYEDVIERLVKDVHKTMEIITKQEEQNGN
jgi:hypothetical protein